MTARSLQRDGLAEGHGFPTPLPRRHRAEHAKLVGLAIVARHNLAGLERVDKIPIPRGTLKARRVGDMAVDDKYLPRAFRRGLDPKMKGAVDLHWRQRAVAISRRRSLIPVHLAERKTADHQPGLKIEFCR